MHLEPPASVVVVLVASWRCGKEESTSCRGSIEKTNIDVCLFVADGCISQF